MRVSSNFLETLIFLKTVFYTKNICNLIWIAYQGIIGKAGTLRWEEKGTFILPVDFINKAFLADSSVQTYGLLKDLGSKPPKFFQLSRLKNKLLFLIRKLPRFSERN